MELFVCALSSREGFFGVQKCRSRFADEPSGPKSSYQAIY